MRRRSARWGINKVPVNPKLQPKPADRAKAAVNDNRALIAVTLALVAGFLAAGPFAYVAIPLAVAAGLLIPKR